MYAEQDTPSDPAHLTPLYFVALLESQVIARQALRRLEALYRQYPDQAFRDEIDALRDAYSDEP